MMYKFEIINPVTRKAHVRYGNDCTLKMIKRIILSIEDKEILPGDFPADVDDYEVIVSAADEVK